MPVPKFDAEKLIQKFKSGQSTVEEQQLVLRWYDQLPEKSIKPDQEEVDQARDEIWQRLESNIQKIPTKKSFNLFYWAAAIFLIGMLFFGGAIYFSESRKRSVESTLAAQQIVPGNHMATLSFSDGKSISLDAIPNGKIFVAGGARMTKTTAGEIIYLPANKPESDITQHTITTPKGGQYQVTLPDGSRAWLNAASSLTYPADFNDRVRQVHMTGEVYFEIARNKEKPFKVKTGQMEVKVLGTHFNVSAYKEDKAVSTTLFEGSVAVNTKNKQIEIHPGEVAIWNKSKGDINAIPADLEAALAWKNGYFIFNDVHIKQIMEKLSRWYNVPVSYQGDLSGLNFNIRISRKSNIIEVLKILESTGTVHFKIEERRVIVSQH